MPLSQEDIRAIAKLARLSLSPEEEIRYAEELSVVLSYVDTLNEVDTGDANTTVQVTGLDDITRDDIAVSASEETKKGILEAFPEHAKNMLAVPRVFEDQ